MISTSATPAGTEVQIYGRLSVPVIRRGEVARRPPGVRLRYVERVVREGTRYTGHYGLDGQTWQEVGSFRTFNLNTSAVRVGLVACGDTGSGSVTALFDYFAPTNTAP